jgi:hypothetical protein
MVGGLLALTSSQSGRPIFAVLDAISFGYELILKINSSITRLAPGEVRFCMFSAPGIVRDDNSARNKRQVLLYAIN